MRVWNSMVWSFVALLLLVAALAPSEVSAQQARATNDGTEVRIDPDPLSDVIATLEAGVVLQWVGESGDYYAVSIPGGPGEDDIVGWVLASELELLGGAVLPDTTDLLIPGGGTPLGGADIPDLQQQYDQAVERRAAGMSKAIQGLGLAAATGAIFALFAKPEFEVNDQQSYATESLYQEAVDRNSSAGNLRDLAIMGGAAVAAYGVAQFILGRQRMNELRLELPRAADPTMQEQYDHANARRLTGRTRVIWGGALILASNGTVAAFSQPVAEDYATASEYESAVDRRNTIKTARNWMTAAGILLGAWGTFDWLMGARDMSTIEDAARTSARAVPFGAGGDAATPSVFVGLSDLGPAVGLNWTW